MKSFFWLVVLSVLTLSCGKSQTELVSENDCAMTEEAVRALTPDTEVDLRLDTAALQDHLNRNSLKVHVHWSKAASVGTSGCVNLFFYDESSDMTAASSLDQTPWMNLPLQVELVEATSCCGHTQKFDQGVFQRQGNYQLSLSNVRVSFPGNWEFLILIKDLRGNLLAKTKLTRRYD